MKTHHAAPKSGPIPHIIEPELRGETPRPVHNTAKANTARRLRWNLFPAVLYAAWFLAAHHASRLNYLHDHGAVALATVTEKGPATDGSTAIRIDYLFLPTPCRTTCKVTFSENVSESEYDVAQTGDTTPVTYLPQDPENFERGNVTTERVQNALGEDFFCIIVGIGLYLMVLGAYEKYYAMRRALLRDGVPAIATILERREPDILRYSFDNPYTGEVIEREGIFSPARYAKLAESTGFTLLYLPGDATTAEPYFNITTAEIGEAATDMERDTTRQ